MFRHTCVRRCEDDILHDQRCRRTTGLRREWVALRTAPSNIEDLSNTHLERKIFQLVDIIMHDLPLSFKDHGVEGRFFACHAEKQLLTYLIWHRTTCLGNAKTLELQDAGTLEDTLIRIYVYQPAQAKPQVCDDCLAFCSEVAMTFGFRLQLWAVGEKNTYLYRSWPG